LRHLKRDDGLKQNAEGTGVTMGEEFKAAGSDRYAFKREEA
jgi:hypothetical protein